MATWLVPLCHLSDKQRAAVEAGHVEHRAICGAPGSGKTQILLHRARHLLDVTRASPDRLCILLYTNVLRDYIASALDVLKIPTGCVSTFDAWCVDYYQSNIPGPLPWDAAEKSRDYGAIRRLVLNDLRINRLFSKGKPFDFVLVDEGQDLPPEAFAILSEIAHHVTVCYDHKQCIYDQGSSESQLLGTLGLKHRNVNLLATFRCSPFVVELAAHFVQDLREREEFRKQNLVSATEKETPVLYLADDFDDERTRLAEIVRSRQAKGESIAILLPSNRQVFGFATGLAERGLEVEVPVKAWKTDSKYRALDFKSNRPKLLTYHSAKGLTFDSVLLPRLVNGSFRGSSSYIKNLLFVGITRATKWVYLSTEREKALSLLEEVRAGIGLSQLTVSSRRSTDSNPLSRMYNFDQSQISDSLNDVL